MGRAATTDAAGGIAGQLDAVRYHWGDAYLIGHDRQWWQSDATVKAAGSPRDRRPS